MVKWGKEKEQGLLELMKVLTGDDRFMEVYNESMEGGHTSMINVFDKVLEQGREQGIKSLVYPGWVILCLERRSPPWVVAPADLPVSVA